MVESNGLLNRHTLICIVSSNLTLSATLNTSMKKATLLIGLLFWVTTSFTVFAQESPPSNKFNNLPMMVDCGTMEDVSALLQKHGEVPTASSMVQWQIPGGGTLSGPMILWVNPDTRTMTITIQPSEGFVCMLLPGTRFAPFIQGTAT